MKRVSYEDVRDEMRTGDLVLFSGKAFSSKLIRFYTRNKFSHVGMIVKSKEMDLVTLWESATALAKDLISNTVKSGVRMTPLSQTLEIYDGLATWRKLEGHDITPEDLSGLKEFRREYAKKEYESGWLELFRAAYDGIGGKNEEDLNSIFCSELVAATYAKLGLTDGKRPANEYTPADFSESREGIRLVKGRLGKEVEFQA